MGGSTATIEYAVAMLGVKHVIVCGHTDCGVMRALLHPESVEDLPAVKSWMIQAETTRRIVRENYADLKGEELLVTTIQENVRIQLDHLKTHPAVAVRVRRGTLTRRCLAVLVHAMLNMKVCDPCVSLKNCRLTTPTPACPRPSTPS